MAKKFEELLVWQEARSLAQQVYSLTKTESFSRDRALVSQIRRCAVSVVSNIAEGFERGGNQEFIQFLFIAKGSSGELRSQIYIALDQGYIAKGTFEGVLEQTMRVSRMLYGMIQSLKESQIRGLKFKVQSLKGQGPL